jgi:tetratricopeptide (TPR) repeat protein
MRILSRGLVGALVLLALTATAAAEDRAQIALQHYKDGMAHFQLEEWDAAIGEWEAGFRAEPKAEFLYNIAQAYRLSKRPEKALSFYQKYLRLAPDAANRDEVERHVASLQKIVDEQKSSSIAPPQQPLPPAKPAEPAAAPSPAANDNAVVASAPKKQPVYKKGWFWGVVGGAVVVVAGAVVLGVVLGGGSATNVGAPVSFR